MIHKHNLTWLAVYCLVVLMFLQLPPMVAKEDSVLNTYRALVEVDALAKQHFVQRIDDDRLVDGAIRGMMLQLDPYSGYISPDELGRFERRHLGEYIGVGLEVGMPDGRATVIAAIEGGPAARVGVLAGDLILEIDGRSTEGLSVMDVEHLLEGEQDTVVHLIIQRRGQDRREEMTIRRGPVGLNTVRGFQRTPSGGWRYMIDTERRIGYVRVGSFRRNTASRFDTVLDGLADQGLAGLIIDLRFNPGGLIDQAIALVDRFVSEGTIVATVTRRSAVRRYLATEPRTLGDLKLVVLINGASASAAEIVAGSLQDHKRAVVIGERSFGKGSVQRLIRLTSYDAAVKMTVAYYCLPSGRIIHRTPSNSATDAWGIRPDVEVVLRADEVKAIQESRRALDGSESAAASGSPQVGAADGNSGGTGGLEVIRDRQLIEALTRLRAELERSLLTG